MRIGSTLVLSTLLSLASFGQSSNLLLRNWIKVSVENLSNREAAPDTGYLRYSFTKSALNISLYPGWNDYVQTWSITGNGLRLGFDTYEVEALNDTALTIVLQGFRRYRFLAEDHLSAQAKYLDSIGQYKEGPLFRANNYLSPRYKGKGAFRNFVQKDLEGFNIKKGYHFVATFVVTAEGKVENVVIRNGITEGFDAAVTRQLVKSSGDWTPARFRGKPVHTEMTYEIKYLASLTPGSSGVLH